MEIELKTKSLKEIIKKCESLGWDPKDVKITSKIFEDLSDPDNFYTKIYIKKSK